MVLRVLRSGRLAIGPLNEQFESMVAERSGRRYGVSCSSGTCGLHLIMKALNIGPAAFKTLAAEGLIQRQYERATLFIAQIGGRLKLLSAGTVNFAQFMQQFVSVAVIIVGVYELADAKMSLGGIIAASMLAGRTMAPLGQVAGLLMQYHNARTALETVEGHMQLPVERPDVIETRIARLGLRMRAGVDFQLTNINDDPRFSEYWQQYHAITARRGVTPAAAKNLLRSRPTLIAALMVERGEADAMICGLVGRYHKKLGYIRSVFSLDKGLTSTSAMTGVINDQGVSFFLDTHVQYDPSAEQIAEATLQASYRLKLFGITPKVALLSHSNFGSHDDASAKKMAQARELIVARAPKLEIDGEMMADTAWDEALRKRIFPGTTLSGRANLFVLPNLDSANIAYNLVRVMTDGVAIGPILMGVDKPAHILTPASTPRRVVNMTAIAAVEAQIRAARGG